MLVNDLLFLFLANKICEEIDSCHRFMKEVFPFISPFSQIRFVANDYSVSHEAFVITVFYDKDKFEHFI